MKAHGSGEFGLDLAWTWLGLGLDLPNLSGSVKSFVQRQLQRMLESRRNEHSKTPYGRSTILFTTAIGARKAALLCRAMEYGLSQ